MTDQNKEQTPLKISYRVTLDIVDKDTGREEQKVIKDGKLIGHVIIKEGSISNDGQT